jgi:hypothetical protein
MLPTAPVASRGGLRQAVYCRVIIVMHGIRKMNARHCPREKITGSQTGPVLGKRI